MQGNINNYVKQVSKAIPTLESQKVKIELVDEKTPKSSMLTDGTVILRLRKNDPQELNFVHGAYLFVSTSLLFRVKRYISQPQREALDLYVTTRLIEKEKSSVVDYFLDEYLHPKLKDVTSPRSEYFNQISVIDGGGLFYPVLLEELHFLGSKVFGGRKDDRIKSDVHELISYLERVTNRVVGIDTNELHFKRDFCRTTIMIIGKKDKMYFQDRAPYIKYIRDVIHKDNIDTAYLLANWGNKGFVDDVCAEIADIYQVYRSKKIKRLLNFPDGSKKLADTYLVVIKRVDTSIYQSNN